jgi:hypothetical protein
MCHVSREKTRLANFIRVPAKYSKSSVSAVLVHNVLVMQYSLLLYQLRLHGLSVSRWIPSLWTMWFGEKRKLRAAYQVNSGRSSAAGSGGRVFLGRVILSKVGRGQGG